MPRVGAITQRAEAPDKLTREVAFRIVPVEQWAARLGTNPDKCARDQDTEPAAVTQPPGSPGEGQRKLPIRSDGETRTRTGDTTIFSRVRLLLSRTCFAGISVDLGVSGGVRVSRTLRPDAV